MKRYNAGSTVVVYYNGKRYIAEVLRYVVPVDEYVVWCGGTEFYFAGKAIRDWNK